MPGSLQRRDRRRPAHRAPSGSGRQVAAHRNAARHSLARPRSDRAAEVVARTPSRRRSAPSAADRSCRRSRAACIASKSASREFSSAHTPGEPARARRSGFEDRRRDRHPAAGLGALERRWRRWSLPLQPWYEYSSASPGIRVVRIGRGDHAELVRVHAEALVLAQALDERRAYVVAPRDAAHVRRALRSRDALLAVLGVGRAPLLVAAELVVRGLDDCSTGPVAALRVALDLRDLDQTSRCRRRMLAARALLARAAGPCRSTTNMRPFDRFELCGIVSTSQPVPASRQLVPVRLLPQSP